MSERKKNIASGIFFLVFAIALYAGSFSIVLTTADVMGPQFFPRTIAIFTAILAVVQIAMAWKKTPDEEKAEAEGEKEGKTEKLDINGVATLAILFLYAVLVDAIGFIIMTALYLFCQISLLLSKEALKSKKTLVVTGLVSVLTPVFIYYLFYYAFSIFLPTGILG